ncbi:MAG: alpha-L-fucosidase [Oscillospiraceae bacterium]|nr:alpha-L-fucosidase [Oscillospiraceae bacterium]
MTNLEERLVSVVPSARQVAWQELEFYAFIHYGINQFTNREWGTGLESPSIFDPQALDTDQWCDCIAKAGMRAVIITAKHHDGFCLWDTKHTEHSVMKSPYGKDIVAQLARSCEKYGLKLGVYLSPWDRHNYLYGSGKAYDDYFCAQLTELLEGYGEIFCVWLDGACGEGSNGQKQRYDWERYYSVVRELQPNAVISVCGPDVRWCGNEAGHCRESEWSVVPQSMADNEKISDLSQKEDDELFRQRKIPSDSGDIGSREVLRDETDLIWYPAEVNTSIRPGWFYHAEEDEQIRPLEELKSLYLRSVGGNAAFLLNIPPHPNGYISPCDAKRLEELGDWIRTSFTDNLLDGTVFSTSDDTYTVTAETERSVSPKYLVLQEDITRSQRVESFSLLYIRDGEWREACRGTVIGHKRICVLPEGIISDKWKLIINACRGKAYVKTFALY